MRNGAVKKVLLMGTMAMVTVGGLVAVTNASPPSGVTPTVLARGTYADFKVRTKRSSPLDVKAKSRSPVDFVVRKHDYAVGSTTGWHSHPGPVFITVTQGTLVYYLYNDRKCTPHVVSAGRGFVDDGAGHIVRNESGQPAQDVSVILAPVAGTFRGELDAPGQYCAF
jgi:hypothetical protein